MVLRKRNQILDDIKKVEEKRNNAKALLIAENRTANSFEEQCITELNEQRSSLTNELQTYDDAMQAMDTRSAQDTPKDGKRAKNLVEQIFEARSLGKDTIEIDTRATIQAKDTNENGKEVIDTELNSIVGPYSDELTLIKAGTKLITGAKKNQKFPMFDGVVSLWADENGDATDGAGKFTSKELAPKRITTQVTLSKMFMEQDTIGASAFIMDEIRKSVSRKLEATTLGSAVATDNMPAGLLSVLPTDKGAMTYERLVTLLTKAKGMNKTFIINSGLLPVLMSTPVFPNGSTAILEGGKIAGRPAFDTDAVASGLQDTKDEYGVICGDFSELIIVEWGNLDITVDGLTKAGQAQVVITANAYYDFGVRRTDAIATATMK